MKKQVIAIIVCIMNYSSLWAMTTSETVVQSFADHLTNWCITKSYHGRENIESICNGKLSFRASDDFMHSLAKRYEKIQTESYVLNDFLSCLKNAIQEGVIVEIVDIKDRTNEVEFRRNDLVCASCIIQTRGKYTLSFKSLFIINTKDNKICRTKNYEESIDKNGKKKVLVDFSDLEDTSMLGFSLNHDQKFPLGASIIGQSSWFLCSLDFGINFDSKKYIIDKVDMTDILNYSRTQKEYDPKMFLTVTPSVFLKYISIGCGVGFVWLSGNENTKDKRALFSQDGSIEGTIDTSVSTNSATLEFMLRPQLRGYIPLSHSCNLSLGVGYDIVPKLKDLNGYNVSIGLHFDFEEWANLF